MGMDDLVSGGERRLGGADCRRGWRVLTDKARDDAPRQREGRNASGGERVAGRAHQMARRERDLWGATFGEPPRPRLNRLLVFAAEADHVGQSAMGKMK